VITKEGKLDPAPRIEACARYRTALHRVMTNACEILEENPDALRYMDTFEIS
jgi:hypothetical protein